ncbi:hypothetical protein [Ottowia testudinis]|uniref:Uncharacterized protein n=1 Tax=Ottowia testudinis TaxID=2816950 RepID=A0A975H2W3_9BURK|nr:hypothetical protein [Ottowia testudinis]QTD45273.1 hypothetical protein J1M35_20030 [Ottowia testudinis]
MHTLTNKLNGYLINFLTGIFLTLFASQAWADRILIIDYQLGPNFNAMPGNLPTLLEGFGHTVTTQTAAPLALSTTDYDQVWVFRGNSALNPILTPYLAQGGAVYYQSEVGCCDNSAAGAQALMSSVGNSQALQSGFSHTVSVGGVHPLATGSALPAVEQACVPTSSNRYSFFAYRRTDNINPSNVLLTASGDPATVFLRASDMTSGKGALIVNGDRNLFSNYLSGSTVLNRGGMSLPVEPYSEVWVKFFVDALRGISQTNPASNSVCGPVATALAPVPSLTPLMTILLAGIVSLVGWRARKSS